MLTLIRQVDSLRLPRVSLSLHEAYDAEQEPREIERVWRSARRESRQDRRGILREHVDDSRDRSAGTGDRLESPATRSIGRKSGREDRKLARRLGLADDGRLGDGPRGARSQADVIQLLESEILSVVRPTGVLNRV